jgi:hypothetical protein
MSGGEASIRKGMERTRLRKPSRSQYKGTRPVDPALLAPAAKSTPPEREHQIPKHAQTREVPWYRVVVEVALHDRLEPLAGLAQRDRTSAYRSGVAPVVAHYLPASSSVQFLEW